MIKVKQVSKRIKDKVILENIDFEVRDNEILGLVGANGAGKTTLLNIIAGIWPPDKGDVEINEINIQERDLDAKAWGNASILSASYKRPVWQAAMSNFSASVRGFIEKDLLTLNRDTVEKGSLLILIPWFCCPGGLL